MGNPVGDQCLSTTGSIIVAERNQWEKRYTTVNKWIYTLEGGRGPTRSTCMWPNRCGGFLKVSNEALVCVWIFPAWHAIHSLAQTPTCFCSVVQIKFKEISFLVKCMDGCERLWTKSNTFHLQLLGTVGLTWPVDKLHSNVAPWSPKAISFSWKCFTGFALGWTSVSPCWAEAMVV